jgi:hypothetical protein
MVEEIKQPESELWNRKSLEVKAFITTDLIEWIELLYSASMKIAKKYKSKDDLDFNTKFNGIFEAMLELLKTMILSDKMDAKLLSIKKQEAKP